MGQRGRRCIRHSVRYLCSFKHARICEVQPPKADCSSGRSQTISFNLECNTWAYMLIWSSVKSLSELWSPSLLKCMTECILRWWLLMDCRGWWSHLCAGESLSGSCQSGEGKENKRNPLSFSLWGGGWGVFLSRVVATCKGYGNSQPLKLWDMAYCRIISCSTMMTMPHFWRSTNVIQHCIAPTSYIRFACT